MATTADASTMARSASIWLRMMRSRSSFWFAVALVRMAAVLVLSLTTMVVVLVSLLTLMVSVLALASAMIDAVFAVWLSTMVVTPFPRSSCRWSRRLKLASIWLTVTSAAQNVDVSKKPVAMSAAMARGMQAAAPLVPRKDSVHTKAAAARIAVVVSFAISCT